MNGARGSQARSAAEIFREPAQLAVISAFGLVSALVGDGFFDLLSWLLLALPVAVIAFKLRRPRPG